MENAPEALHHYLKMWNETDIAAIRPHLDQAVSDDCLWVDPQNHHVGRDALLENVVGFRTKYPNASLTLASNMDGHHQRYRYEWRISVGSQILIEGLDVATLNAAGLIERVDGFFGPLKRTG